MRLILLAVTLSVAAHLGADARADYLAAVEAQKAGHWDEAAQGYTKVSAQLPKFAPAWKQLASARYYLGDKEGAVASADRYLALKPDDAAFSAWADKLRAALKLPPRVVAPATAAPAAPIIAVPVAAPAPAPDAGLEMAPPPGADAQIVAPESAALINDESSAAVAQVEADSAVTSSQQMADEADAILRRREPPRGKLAVGLRLLGGAAWGLGRFEHGEDVNSATVPNNKGYNGQPAGGGTGALELTVGFGSQASLLLGLYPVLWSDSRKSSQTTTVTRSNSSEASATLLPLMVGAGWKQPLMPGFNALLAAGVGAIPSASVRVKSQTVQTFASSLTVDDIDATLDYGLAPAWRVMLGGEWALNPAWSFDLGLQALGATFSDAGGTATLKQTDQNGVTTPGYPLTVTVLQQALNVLSVSLLAGLHVAF